jgi:hypothetical protein
MTGTRPDARNLLPEEQWEFLFQKTLRFAQYQIDRLPWRGEPGGILPDGFDANSIAAQAIMDWLASLASDNARLVYEAPPSVSHHLIEPPNASTIIQRFNDLTSPQRDLNRFVLKHVTRLHHRKENFLMRNAEDLLPVLDMDDEPISILELIPAPDGPPDASLLNNESLSQVHELKTRFEAFLAKDRPLINLFELGWDGISKPQTVAAHLKLAMGTVRSRRKRLKRKWQAFFQGRTTRDSSV